MNYMINVKAYRYSAAVEYLEDHLNIEFTTYKPSEFCGDDFVDEYFIVINDSQDVFTWQLAGGIESMENYIWERD